MLPGVLYISIGIVHSLVWQEFGDYNYLSRSIYGYDPLDNKPVQFWQEDYQVSSPIVYNAVCAKLAFFACSWEQIRNGKISSSPTLVQSVTLFARFA